MTWTLPIPAEAKISCASPETSNLLDRAARHAGGEIPRPVKGPFFDDVRGSDVFNGTILWSLDELEQWENRFGIELEKGPARAFQRYFDSGHVVYGTLVNHPEVPDPDRWAFCSIILQRALIVHTGRRQTTVFRSYFHSRTDKKGEAVSFVPAHDIEVSFPSETVWFPLALTEFIAEEEAQVALDILTPRVPRFARDTKKQRGPAYGGADLEVVNQGSISSGRHLFHTARLAGALRGKREYGDLSLEI